MHGQQDGLDREGRWLGAGIRKGHNMQMRHWGVRCQGWVRTGMKRGLKISFITTSKSLHPNNCIEKATSEWSTHTHIPPTQKLTHTHTHKHRDADTQT